MPMVTGFRQRRSLKKLCVGEFLDGVTPGEATSERAMAIIIWGKQRRWACILLMVMASMIWLATCGDGHGIGGLRTTNWHPMGHLTLAAPMSLRKTKPG